ncbi:proton extrusion protein PcxA, partial [Chamaesiphon polymorphus]
NNYPQSREREQFDRRGGNDLNPYTQDIEYEARILEKLSFIDEILTRYADRAIDPLRSSLGERAIDFMAPPEPPEPPEPPSSLSISRPASAQQNRQRAANLTQPNPTPSRRQSNRMSNRLEQSNENVNNDKKAVIDISIINTFRRIQQDLNPNADVQVLENYRFSQSKTRTSLRFILMMILVPLLVQYISKIVVVGPVVDAYRSYQHADVFLNVNLEKEAFEEIETFEKQIKFQQLVGLAPKLTPKQQEEQIKHKAEQVKVNFYRKSSEAVKNWFADILAVITFSWLITHSKQQIEILKSFFGDLIYGLSDTAKAFIIILLTDTFVGFHSPHGWEIILEGTAKHLGIADNNGFNSLFIATFPVLMDTVFKYWIFRYLTGQSPSSVATYKSMNE